MKNDDVLLRQQLLIVRSGQLRATISDQSQILIKPLAFADKVRVAVTWLYHNPAWPMGTILGLLVLKPRRVIIWGSRLWAAWKTFKRLEALLVKTPSHRQST